MEQSLTNQNFWDSFWNDRSATYRPRSLHFTDILQQYVKPGMHCFEIGCVPGRYMTYLAKELQCDVSGIDFSSDFSGMLALFQQYGVTPKTLVQDDFFKYEPQEQYDFVYSLGFIEHFTNFEEVITRHIPYVKPGGYLFLETPNYRGAAQNFLHSMFDPESLNDHYLPSMNLQVWDKVLAENGMRVLESRYYKTFDFWAYKKDRSKTGEMVVNALSRYSRRINDLVNLPNQWTSPFLINVSQKPLTQ